MKTKREIQLSLLSATRQISHRYSSLAIAMFAALLILLLISSTADAQRIVATYPIPQLSRGLAHDGSVLWIGGVGDQGNWIRAFDPLSGAIIDSIPAPVPDCIGLTAMQDGLAYISSRSDTVYLVRHDGYTALFVKPYQHLGGLATENSKIWSATYFDPQGLLVQMDTQGRITRSLPHSGRHTREMAYHRERLYIADRLNQEIRVVNPETGRLFYSFDTEGINPDGIASDGTYLWVTDDGDQKGQDQLYQYWIQPEGNIRLSSVQHNFGSVVIDETKTWTVWVYNDGARPARRNRFEFRNGNDDIFVPHVWNFPEEIQPGDSAALRVTFQPAFPDSTFIEFGLTYDIDRETYWIQLAGKGVRPRREMLLHTRFLDFGISRFGHGLQSSNLRYVTIENNGGEPLTIRDFSFNNGAFSHGYYDFPQTFDEPGLINIPVFFKPNMEGFINGTLTITSDAPNAPEVSINLTGVGRLHSYQGGTILWQTPLGDRDNELPRIRAIQDIDDVTGDGLADVVIATNDYHIRAYHAAATDLALSVWAYNTDINPWRRGLVETQRALSSGYDWDNDGVVDIVFGLGGGAKRVIALSGRTGEEIWIFDTHGLQGGGGELRVVQGTDDFNEDGVNDVYCASAGTNEQNATNSVFVLNGRTGLLLWLILLDSPPIDLHNIDDVTGDGIPDLVAILESGAMIGIDGRRGQIIWENEARGLVVSNYSMPDVNGDNSRDFVVVTEEHGIYMFNGSNGVRLWHILPPVRITVSIGLNDLNGNGSPDLVFGDTYNFIRAIDGSTSAAVWDTSMYLGAEAISMSPLPDFDRDGLDDFMAGTATGRIYALSGSGYGAVWSFSNAGEGQRGFHLVVTARDIDGNNEPDVFAAMATGTVFCFAGSYIGVGIEDEFDFPYMPQSMIVDPAYPNPFNSFISIPISLRMPSPYNVKIFNVMGQEIFRHSSELVPAGTHRFVWNGTNRNGLPVPSGMYFIEVTNSDHSVVRRIELLR